jgi:hypothetical protein
MAQEYGREYVSGHLTPRLPGYEPGARTQTSSLTEGIDVTPHLFPGYRRLTSVRGGDLTATWQVVGDGKYLQIWLESYLGYHYREMYEGIPTFAGRVRSMKLVAGDVILTASLDHIFNHIACYYTSIVTGQSNLTTFYSDVESRKKWGTRTLLIRPTEYLTQLEAEETTQQALARLAHFRIVRAPVQQASQKQSLLSVNVEGYGLQLNDTLFSEPNPGQENADTAVTNTIDGSEFIYAQLVRPNSRQITITADYSPKLQRLLSIVDKKDASGRTYAIGCFQGRGFFYYPVEETVVKYNVYVSHGRTEHYAADQSYVPAPMVQPGGISFTPDILAGRPRAKTLTNDPRAQFDEAVEYRDGTAVLRGRDWSAKDRAEAISLAILSRRS